MHVLLETESWRFISEKAYIGLYNFDPESNAKDYTFKLTEILEEDILPQDLKFKH